MDCIQSKRRNRRGPIMVQDRVLVHHNMCVIKKWQRTSKLGPGCGCLLSARPMWSPIPRPNYPVMTRDVSRNAYASISFIIEELFKCGSVIPACISSCVMSCACTGFLGDSNQPNTRGRLDHKCQSVSAKGPGTALRSGVTMWVRFR